jgi:4-diphosphocytidyl-2-C-methyl-D-erythritol kinase
VHSPDAPWPAPAKLNLMLHVTGRRADGYHELQTVFQFLDFGDYLRFELTDDGSISLARPLPGVPDDTHLCVRAARALQGAGGVERGVRIDLEKRLPVGGGLGGGSSDAATTLVALNHLWQVRLPVAELARIGLELGADVPVFVHGHASWAEGVGERLQPVDLPEPVYLVACPGVVVSTAEVFARPELTRDSPPITIRAFREGQGRNDLEPVVRSLYPEVDRTLSWLADHGPAQMSGSGACGFVELADRDLGEELLAQRPAGTSGFVAQGLNRSPLQDRLARERATTA